MNSQGPRSINFVELAIGEAPHERLVFLQTLRRDQPHQHRPLAGVIGWVHRDHVLVHRELIAVAVDDPADVVAFERHGKAREGPDHRVAGREGVGIAVDVGGLVPPRHRDHPVVGQRRHRALRAQVFEVRVRVFQQRRVGKEVDLFVVGLLVRSHEAST